MKGIVLAGGTGSRLRPLTDATNKHLLRVHDKPMIHHAISALMLAGVRQVLVISTPRDTPAFERLLGDGRAWGLELSYAVQPRPEGLAQALLIARPYLAGGPSALVLGDTLLHGADLEPRLREAAAVSRGAVVLARKVADPQAYGVVELDGAGRPVSLEEKPARPRSELAVPGVYFYDAEAPALAAQLRPSARGELEITDLNRSYLERGLLRVEVLDARDAWFDLGTHEALRLAAGWLARVEAERAVKIGSPEETAWRLGYIDGAQLRRLADAHPDPDYSRYLRRLVS